MLGEFSFNNEGVRQNTAADARLAFSLKMVVARDVERAAISSDSLSFMHVTSALLATITTAVDTP